MFKRRIIDTAKFKEVSIEDVLYTIRPDNENILTDLYYREVEFDKEVEEEHKLEAEHHQQGDRGQHAKLLEVCSR